MTELILISLWFAVLLCTVVAIIFLEIMPKYKLESSETSFEELILALNAVIQTEFDLWEKNVFVDKKSITNSNFENFYTEISLQIYKSLSPIFFRNISRYITEDAVASIIGRKTKEYLITKIDGV